MSVQLKCGKSPTPVRKIGPDSKGAEIHQSVAPRTGEKVFIKHAPNAFFQIGLSDELLRQNIRHTMHQPESGCI